MTEHMERPAIAGFFGEHRWLSNFWPSQVEVDGVSAASAEHLYQAAKCQHQADAELILALETPREAKRAAQEMKIRADWDDIKIDTMKRIVRAKFEDPILLMRLHETGDADLIEANHWHDTFWGMCICDAHRFDGENHLGRILMEIRTKVRDVELVS